MKSILLCALAGVLLALAMYYLPGVGHGWASIK